MFDRYMQATVAGAALVSLAAAVPTTLYAPIDARGVFPRQNFANSTCNSYGIDFVGGGSYFINSLSTDNFTTVSQFEGCNNDDASVLLVNDATLEEFECTQLPTVPEDVSQLSTCPIQKDMMDSGDWSVLVIGNNGNGMPFAYERDFYLTVAPQQTVTETPTATYTVTLTPTTSATSTSVIDYTTTFTNNLTVTVPATTDYITVTPSEVTITQTDTYTNTVDQVSKTQVIITSTVTPFCTIPPRPYWPDRTATITPTAMPMPFGMNRRDVIDAAKARVAAKRAASSQEIEEMEKRGLAKRSADMATVTSTATFAVNTTTTVTAPTSTNYIVEFSTTTCTTTLPPTTVKAGTEYDTITAPTPTDTLHTAVYTSVTSTSTIAVTWTYTTTTTPSSLETNCRREGGHFGGGYW